MSAGIAVAFVLTLLPAFLPMRGATASAAGDMPAQMGPADAGDTPAGVPPDHAAHHGGEPGPDPAPASAPPPGPGTAGAGGCGGMMGCLGGTKPFYPALLTMPSLTPQARRFIEAEADKRLGTGSEAISAGQAALHHALAANDLAAIRQAVAGLREAVLQVESGVAARLALDQGQAPPQIALNWFKGQMSTPAAADGMTGEEGPWGLSWYHLAIMLFLVAFLLAAMLIHHARARRIGQLVHQLTQGASPAAPAGVSTPPPAAAAGAPAPAAPATGAAPSEPAPKPAPGPAQAWSGKLRIAAIFQETPDVKTFRLMAPAGGAIPFTFLPGQFLAFAAEIDAKRIRRSYTIASPPSRRDYVEITVKREQQGLESRYLHDNLAAGDLLDVSGPSGVFTFTGNEAGSIVLIAGGVGITPMMCVIRYLTDRAFAGDIFFLYGARTSADFIFYDELEYLRKRHPNLHVAATMASVERTSWTGATGTISKDFIAHAVPEIARRLVHVCGPPGMMEAVKAELAELGVPKDRIRTEAFGPALGAAPAPAAPAQTAPAPATAVVPSAQAQIQFSKSGKTGTLAPDQCVLEAAEAIGVAIDFSCRVGTCGTCVVPLVQGSVTMEVEAGLAPADKARGLILACQAKSTASLVVDA